MDFSIDIKFNLIYDSGNEHINAVLEMEVTLEGLKISLAAARVNAGLTQEEVAKFMRVSKNTVVAWEKGNTEPKISQAKELSNLYQMPLDHIFLPEISNKI